MPLKKRILVISSLIVLIISFSGTAFSQTAPDSARAARASALRELLSSIEGVAKAIAPYKLAIFFGFFRYFSIAELERVWDNGNVQSISEKSTMHAQEHILFEQVLFYRFKKESQEKKNVCA